jgi:glycosyltransferase involved in cell wall biosynthesis
MPDVCLISKVWRSGTGWYAQMLSEAIGEAGARIAFISPAAEPREREPKGSNLKRVFVPRELKTAAPRWRRLTASLRRSISSTVSAISLRRNTGTYIFNIPEPFIFTLPLFVFLRMSGAKIIYIVHDAVPHKWRFDGFLRSFEDLLYRVSYALPHHLVVLAPAARQVLVDRYGISADKIGVIPHGPFSTGSITPMPGTGRLLCFGTVRRNKNVLETIRAVKSARAQGLDVTLQISGEIHPLESDYWDTCLAEIRQDEAGFDLDIRFVPDASLPELIAKVDAFVLPYEDFSSQSGVAVLAATSGRPVIGTASGGLADLFAAGMAGVELTSPVSSDAILKGIYTFKAESIGAWSARAAVGAERVQAEIAWSRVAQRFLTIVHDLNPPAPA